MNIEVTEYIDNAPQEQKEIMNSVREIIHQILPSVIEEFKWGRPIFKSSKDFAYFKINKNYLTIGFTKDIEKLNDPNKILEGTGKTMRHLKLKDLSEVDNSLLKEWFTIISTP